MVVKRNKKQMNLSTLTKNLQTNVENKATDRQKAAKARWAKVKQSHPTETKFLELVNEIIGKPAGIQITANNAIIYRAGKFSPARNFDVILNNNYDWMDKPRKPKIYAKKAHYEHDD